MGTIVYRDKFDNSDHMMNGSASRHVSEIILYDENGPLITNYTNINAYKFETERKISTRPIDSPDWNNKNGFIIREDVSSVARCYSGTFHLLFIHISNVPKYASEFLDYWQLYMPNYDFGAIQCEFSLEGCHFNRIVGNKRVEYAKRAISDLTDKYFNPDNSEYRFHVISSARDCTQAVDACTAMVKAITEYRKIVDDVITNYGIVELIHENGADKPIGPNDYESLSRYGFMNNDLED